MGHGNFTPTLPSVPQHRCQGRRPLTGTLPRAPRLLRANVRYEEGESPANALTKPPAAPQPSLRGPRSRRRFPPFSHPATASPLCVCPHTHTHTPWGRSRPRCLPGCPAPAAHGAHHVPVASSPAGLPSESACGPSEAPRATFLTHRSARKARRRFGAASGEKKGVGMKTD